MSDQGRFVHPMASLGNNLSSLAWGGAAIITLELSSQWTLFIDVWAIVHILRYLKDRFAEYE